MIWIPDGAFRKKELHFSFLFQLLTVDTLYNVMCDEDVEVNGLENGTGANTTEDESELLEHSTASSSYHTNSSSASNGSPPKDLGVQFTEMFIKQQDVISCLLTALEDFDFQLRWAIARFIHLLLENAQTKVQEIVLTSPTAVSKVVDLLSDPREVIRNEAIILLIFLSHQNTPLQKLIAFEGVFEKVLGIIEAEGFSDGLIVVEDCINLINQLLSQNSSNLNFFLESGYTQQVSKFFNFSTVQNEEWQAQKINNVLQMLHLVQSLVSPQNPQQTILAYQKILFKHGVLNKMAVIVVSSGLDSKVMSEAIVCIGNLIANNRTNQNFFENVMTMQSTPKPSILSLLMTMVNEKQKLPLRTAILYCFHSYLMGNEDKQSDIISTLLPSKVDTSNVTSGQLLCRGLFSRDPCSNWLCSVGLSYALNDKQKEKLLRVQLATSIGNAPVTLMQHAVSILTKNESTTQTKIGMMILLCTWLHNCPTAVSSLLRIPTAISFFISYLCDTSVYPKDEDNVSRALAAFLLGICYLYNEDNKSVCEFDRKGLKHIIEKRMGLELFRRNMGLISTSESFGKNSQKTYLTISSPEHLILDFEIVTLFKSLESKILDALSGAENEASKEVEALKQEIASLKDTVKKQDSWLKNRETTISELNQKIAEINAEKENLKYQIDVMSTVTPVVSSANVQTDPTQPEPVTTPLLSNYNYYPYYQQAQQYAMANGQSYYNAGDSQTNVMGCQDVKSSEEYQLLFGENSQLKAQVEHYNNEFGKLSQTNTELQNQIASLTDELKSKVSDASNSIDEEKLKWYEAQYPILQQQYEQIYSSFYELQTSFNEKFDPEQKIQHLQAKVYECESVNAQWAQSGEFLNQQIVAQNETIAGLNANNEALKSQVNELNLRVASLENDKVELTCKVEELSLTLVESRRDQTIQNGFNESELSAKLDNINVNSKVNLTVNGGANGEVPNGEEKQSYEEIEKELNDLRLDQDNLLLLLADQDTKIKKMKNKIKDRDSRMSAIKAGLVAMGASGLIGEEMFVGNDSGNSSDDSNDENVEDGLKHSGNGISTHGLNHHDRYSLNQTDSSVTDSSCS